MDHPLKHFQGRIDDLQLYARKVQPRINIVTCMLLCVTWLLIFFRILFWVMEQTDWERDYLITHIYLHWNFKKAVYVSYHAGKKYSFSLSLTKCYYKFA